MMQIKTGIDCIDAQLSGGITPDTVTLIYGEPETGKTTIALQCAVNCAMQNRKVLFVDCDNT
ncbi:MAG TPA: ATPase domain-containing protein, partial [Candidatus Deferrimicrobiaceae bacterium]|nr:ATPase domain-containing protein [Candidatus Deferrimicrobiaceae bacterium]